MFKKLRQRMLTALMTVVMVLGAAVPAQAALTANATGSVTITNLAKGDTVHLYRFIDTSYDVATNNLTHAWSGSLTDAAMGGSDALSTYLSGNTTTTWPAQSSKVEALLAHLRENVGSATGAGSSTAGASSVTFSNLPMGAYYVQVESADGAKFYQDMVFNVQPAQTGTGSYDAPAAQTLAAKSSGMTITKKLDDATNTQGGGATSLDSTTSLAVGDKVNYTITVPIPKVTATDANQTLTVTDTFTASQLELDASSVVVKADNTTITSADGTSVSTGTAGKLVVSLSKLSDYRSNTNLIITYTMTVKDDDANTLSAVKTYSNTASVEFSPDPNKSDTKTISTNAVTIKTYGITFKKVDKDSQTTVLPGAVFELYKKEDVSTTELTVGSSTVKVRKIGELTSDASGVLSFDTLGTGTYYLKEIKAPNGYQLDSTIYTRTISAASDPSELIAWDAITNAKNPILPTTGGVGTVLFTIGGLVLMAAGAFFFIILKRRRDEKEEQQA